MKSILKRLATKSEKTEWAECTETFVRILHARFICYELTVCGRFAGFSVKDIEKFLIGENLLRGLLSPSIELDDALLLRELRVALDGDDHEGFMKLLQGAFRAHVGYIGKVDDSLKRNSQFASVTMGRIYTENLRANQVTESKREKWYTTRKDLHTIISAMTRHVYLTDNVVQSFKPTFYSDDEEE